MPCNSSDAEVNDFFLPLFEWKGAGASRSPGKLEFGRVQVPVRNGIPRFTSDVGYSSNFDLLRREHARLQLDSVNRTSDRLKTLLQRTNWPATYFADKVILECGCGAGPDTEILLGLGAKVVSVDLAGVDVAQENIGNVPSVQFVQGSITELPFKKAAFDIVFCHRVLQHTPDPETTLSHILDFVRPGGAAFVHSYSNSLKQRLRWKYALLPLTRRLAPERLYKLVRSYAGAAYRFTNWTGRTRIGRRFNWIFVPFLNYRYLSKFDGVSDEAMLEYGIHDTFDALSPRYDKPISVKRMRAIASQKLSDRFEVVDNGMITLLRTVVSEEPPADGARQRNGASN